MAGMDQYYKFALILNANPKFSNTMDIDDLKTFIINAEKVYYNAELTDQESILEDTVYDYIKSAYEQRIYKTPPSRGSHESHESQGSQGSQASTPIHSPLSHVPTPKGRLSALPVFLGSMDKLNHGDGKIHKWKMDFPKPYVVSCKMDGASAVYINNDKLMSRGKNMMAQDLSPMLQYLNLPKIDGVMIRGELIYKKSVFNSKHKKTELTPHLLYKNSRNAIAGLVNSIGSGGNPISGGMMYDVEFVAYEVIPIQSTSPMTCLDQMKFLEEQGFNVVTYTMHDDVNDSLLSDLYDKYLTSMEGDALSPMVDYSIDGLIVCSNHVYPRAVDKNPAHARAYKKPLAVLTGATTVLSIEWNVTRHGKWFPTVLLEPIEIDDVTISRVTGNNARHLVKNMISGGAIVEIIRSGGVIPKITKVIQQAEEFQYPDGNYKWSTSNVDLVVEDYELITRDITIKRLAHFASTIGAKGFGEVTVGKLYDLGYTDICSLLSICTTKQGQSPAQSPAQSPSSSSSTGSNIGAKTYSNLSESMKNACSTVTLSLLMTASSVFSAGLGERKFTTFLEHTQHILNKTMLTPDGNRPIIHGFGDATFDNLSENLSDFIDLIVSFPDTILSLFNKIHVNKDTCVIYEDIIEKATSTTSSTPSPQLMFINQKHFYFTGFRDIILSKFVQDNGGIIDAAMTTKTNILVLKDSSYQNKKTQDAETRGIKIMTRDDLHTLHTH